MPRRIVGFIQNHPWATAFGIIGFIISGLISPLMQLQWNARHPENVEIKQVSVEELKDRGFLLTVKLHAPAVPDCLRVSQHLIYRELPGLPREYMPLGSALNGMNFAGSTEDIDIVLKIHPNTAFGWGWNYIDRSAYFCIEWPGLLMIKQIQSKAYPIDLPSETGLK